MTSGRRWDGAQLVSKAAPITDQINRWSLSVYACHCPPVVAAFVSPHTTTRCCHTEWGNPRYPGQVLGGRWKPLHYWYRTTIFADVMATCDGGGKCVVRNDAPSRPFAGTVTVTLTSFATGERTQLARQQVSLPAGVGATEWFHLPGGGGNSSHPSRPPLPCPARPCGPSHPGRTYCPDGVPNQCDAPPREVCPPCSGPAPLPGGGTHVLEAVVTETQTGSVVSHNVIALARPELMQLLPSKATVAAVVGVDGSLAANVTVSAVAMYVTLTTAAHGRFEDNAFLLAAPYTRLVQFLPAVPGQAAAFVASLRVEDLSTYL